MFRVTAAAAALSALTFLSLDLPAKTAAPAGGKDLYIVVMRDSPVAAHTATRERGREASRPMVAAVGCVVIARARADFRRAAEFSGDHDERFVEQTMCREVVEQGRHATVGWR